MRKTILITGICGFVGRHMCDYLASLPERQRIIGIDIPDTPPSNCDSFYSFDLSSAEKTENVIKQTKPDFIIHLAGTFGENNRLETYRVNILSIVALLEAVRKYMPGTVTIAAGSAAEYGRIEPDQLPVDEQTPCKPVTPYGLSKYLATQIALYYHHVHNICTMIVRPFQLVGKGVSVKLAPGAFAEQLKLVVSEGSEVIKVGNLDSHRDFLDIRDAVEGIWTLCQHPAPGEIYNLCFGTAIKIADLLEAMISLCGVNVKVQIDPCRLRGSLDVSTVYGSYRKINNHCGWQPKRSLAESVKAMLD
jgi:GDP-4-dehydro-6-deoxy-D-mannose reductase